MYHSQENLSANLSKTELYAVLTAQASELLGGETDYISGLANVVALLHRNFKWWWTGFYLVKGETLVLGPFQGDVACSRIAFGKGVCGTAWEKASTILVEDVDQFPGHIACSAASKSEIVVPIIVDQQVVAVLDVDSEHLAYFDETDRVGLESIVQNVARWIQQL